MKTIKEKLKGDLHHESSLYREGTSSNRTILPGNDLKWSIIHIWTDSGKSCNRRDQRKYIETQAEQVMKNLGEVLKEAGSSFEKAVKTTCFLADMGDFAKFNEVYAKYFVNKPARSCVAVKTLPKNVLCEVEVIAEV